ncbi:MAG TPA: alpha/beta hydrolase [Ktedonobacteraceae bacterium]|nr:alpha/beta hydrolase [Ktedonobacteraceae bacterium]
MPQTHVNGFDLYYEEGGQGTPVVFVHGGFPSLASTLNDFSSPNWQWTWENDFAESFHFIYYERRGCYRSSCPDSGYDMANQALDLASLLDVLNVASAHIIGSSAGGPISLAFAALYPRRVRSLTLAGTTIDLFPADDPISNRIRQLIAVLENEGAEAAFAQRPEGVETSLEPLWVVNEMKARGRYARFLEREQQLAERARTMPEAERVRYLAAELRSMQAYMQGYTSGDLQTWAAQVKCPTLVLHGSDDREVPLAWGEPLATIIPTARMHVITGGGHSLVHRSVEGRRIVIDFIQSTQL